MRSWFRSAGIQGFLVCRVTLLGLGLFVEGPAAVCKSDLMVCSQSCQIVYQRTIGPNLSFSAMSRISHMGGCQHYGPFLGTLNIRCRSIIGTQKGTIILTIPPIFPNPDGGRSSQP